MNYQIIKEIITTESQTSQSPADGYDSCPIVHVFADDLSANKTATQSTTYVDVNNVLYKASNAVDRDIESCMRTKEIGPNSPYQTVWWMVDLGEVYNIHSVKILFKNYPNEGTGVCL